VAVDAGEELHERRRRITNGQKYPAVIVGSGDCHGDRDWFTRHWLHAGGGTVRADPEHHDTARLGVSDHAWRQRPAPGECRRHLREPVPTCCSDVRKSCSQAPDENPEEPVDTEMNLLDELSASVVGDTGITPLRRAVEQRPGTCVRTVVSEMLDDRGAVLDAAVLSLST